ncbi:hypothetical protein EDEG_00562 [Edhazardia aedis USNM 41457]|uniref:DUF5096 domain-containing protein n=1 Tax=Edhazardia aedis (strain USNM 41457) TaxID=1003232 RepID=J9D0X6_EDHAE|nr:hypothetical protein EDEG_00562 [Edhazardia aedis USNM 41457]|eukprot:EJW01229.1 hypothetical protein EDEG_00562 [Edhazardia aedis USNM 41457]
MSNCAVVLGNNNIYTKIGFYIANHFLKKKIDVFYTDQIVSTDFSREYNYFLNNGGTLLQSSEKKYDCCIYFSKSVCKKVLATKNYILNGVPKTIPMIENPIFLCIGFPYFEILKYNCSAIILKCGFSQNIYDLFNLII